MTLENYLRDALSKGIIDHSIRATITEGTVTFYIHPTGKDGNTCDFAVIDGNSLQSCR